MKQHIYKIGIALITLSIGITATSVWIVKHYSSPDQLFIYLAIKSGVSIKSSLPCEVTQRDIATAKTLLASGIDVDSTADSCINMEPSPRDQTLLMNAARGGDQETVEFLLKKGANVNAMNSWRDTPLSYAIRNKHIEIIRLLIDKGADIQAKGENKETPLMSASDVGNLEVIEYLLSRDADINAKDENHVTALIYAASNRHSEVMKLLLERGADPKAEDKDGRTVEAYLKNGFPNEYINWKE